MIEAPIQSWSSHEREFCIYADKFIKRSFRPNEYLKNIHGDTVVPPQGYERLQNEAACLEFILTNTDIPVPKVLETYEENGSFILVTEFMTGRVITDLQPEDQVMVIKEVESYVETLRSLRSNCPGGPTGIICPLPRIVNHFPPGTIQTPIKAPEAEFRFCHCDLSWSNIIIDADSPRIRAILDWEYAGFWPEFFDLPYYRDTRPSGAQFIDAPEWTQMIDFLRSHQQG